MDYKKIGNFIATERKAKNLTQSKLANKLFVSEKTISKWENGNGLPDTSLLIKLCEILEVNLNELLSGERLSDDNYKENAEENLSKLMIEKKDNRMKLIISFLVCFISLSSLLVSILLVGYLQLPTWISVCLIIYGSLVFIIGLSIATILDVKTGTYECKHCKTKFVPSLKSYFAGAHTLTTRFLKCPHCGKSGYCKKRLTK